MINSLKRDEHGSLAVWMMGLCIMLLFLGGISVDLWRGYTARRSFASVADSMAIAGTSAIQEEHFRQTSEVRLDEAGARHEALKNLEDQKKNDPNFAKYLRGVPDIRVNDRGTEVTVRIQGAVDMSLLGILSNFNGSTPEADRTLAVNAKATAQINEQQ